MRGHEIIHAVAHLRADRPTDGLWKRVQEHAVHRSAVVPDIIFWTYRCMDAPKNHNFAPLYEHWVRMAKKFHPGAAVMTCAGGPLDMFDRAFAMTAFVHSPAFSAQTMFMDHDAFPNRDLRNAPVEHVGVTKRIKDGFMPINEGVIVAQPTEETRAFFRAYLGTFESILANCKVTTSDEKDLKWWGGQLSLNVVCPESAAVTYLPFDDWNFGIEPDVPISYADLDAKHVLHLKGGRKAYFEQIRAYQEARCA
jgi:hypothetical protein